jgi:hypothetical protein
VKIFLSYPIQNLETARLITEELEKSGYKVWVFFNEVPKFNPDHSLKVQEGIESADLILVLVSQEIIYAQYRNKPILPIMIEPTKVPFSLLGTQYLDISDDLSGSYGRIIEAIRQLKFTQPAAQDQSQPLSAEELAQDRKRILTSSQVVRIFIAYSRHQQPLAKDLSEMLIKHGNAVFWDAKIKAGASWRQTIQKALDDATHVLVIWTHEAASSDEVEREVSYALAERKVIVPILSKEIPKLPYHLHGLH